jgi:hypothetical protein
MGFALPLTFLKQAAPGYLTDSDWDGLGEDWLEQALAYTAAPCKGIRGPLARIRPRPADSVSPAREPAYRLADYLDQHGRSARGHEIPPPEFWAAAASHVTAADQAVLGDAAHNRGLYRDAAQLHKNAAIAGGIRSVLYFVSAPVYLAEPPGYPHLDPRAARWAVDHVRISAPDDVAELLENLTRAGAGEQVAALLARDPAAHADLSHRSFTQWLLHRLQEAGADQQVTALLARDPELSFIVDTLPVGLILSTNRAMYRLPPLPPLSQVPVTRRGIEPAHAASPGLSDAVGVARELDSLREAGAGEQVSALLARDPAAHADLSDWDGAMSLLISLVNAGADDQAAALLARSPAHLGSGFLVIDLVGRLRRAGVHELADALVSQLSAAGQFRTFLELQGDQFRFGRETDGTPAEPWGWDDLALRSLLQQPGPAGPSLWPWRRPWTAARRWALAGSGLGGSEAGAGSGSGPAWN